MAQSDKIDGLVRLTAVLEERLTNVQSQMSEVVDRISELDKKQNSFQEKFAVCENHVKELKDNVKDSASKRSAFWTSLITALIVAALGFALQVVLPYFQNHKK